MSNASVRFLYLPCNDLGAMRHFYTDLVRLDEIYYAEQERMIAYNCDGFQFTILESEPTTVAKGWATQPGWSGGTAAAPSLSIVVPSEVFVRTIERLIKSDVTCRNNEPDWVGYWSFPVHDPMGTTVEITHSPDTPPADTSWLAQEASTSI